MKKFITGIACSLILISCGGNKTEPATSTGSDTTAKAEVKPPPAVEFADQQFMDFGKKALAAMSAGDIDGFVANYADNAVYNWSSGDSLVGIEAIKKYWKDRRANVIDSITFANDIWLPIKINTPQKGPDQPGIWLLGWYQFKSKYKTGKTVSGWIHNDMHFNSSGKIDRSITYIDRAPIVAATKK